MTWNPRTEDDKDLYDDSRTYTVEATIKVKLKVNATKGLDEDDMASIVIDQIEDNCPDVIDTEVQEVDITEVE